ncbi:bifunctional 3-demethylubiquinone 3-O-methyltransferase/2-octaprenyl-6-hydroxy phenol methylase [Micromonospora ureilytica]|uniref:Bifunctional 3-demethylubiquinone 3-O-methyltransferase/2-octaprenyl-6-hydroxy phenol methylase n=1 Tax=Micromonospora ureilytica TaxID=709868 RepID=A0A3N9XW86_9ACTN|nr:methyltransferase domain-containing protein [Micromonospora ureilytica]RQX17378.1 bifunctional 3-demethylubiquinone 3-O-methyltransferase/2-octaprenyl-6-hydroxy phenol methylase [Micromonospora ureilytica]WSR57533.1 methyltransferase domain-containing protein [Micromonospora ureilytica]
MRDVAAAGAATGPRVLPRNDPRQYDDLAGEWWRPDGAFAMLHWLAEARAALVPPATRPDALLVDLGCGAGLLAPHLAGKGYRHVGVDLTRSALVQAADHGVRVVQGDATAVPLPDGCADVVSAGELLEHVPAWPRAVAEACRLLRPGGVLVLDTLNDTALARLVAVRIAERLPTVPRGIHDPLLFVDARALVAECARHGVDLRLRGIRPQVGGMLAWLLRRARASRTAGAVPAGRAPRIVPTGSTAVLYQGRGVRKG